jgi:multidrug efflux pump subunit AcrA (membrane-fusion protein)
MSRRLSLALLAVAVAALAAWGARRVMHDLQPEGPLRVPTAAAKRGDVTFTVVSRGELQGGSSKTLTAPMTGSPQLVLTFLSKSGEVVDKGAVVAQFDTTEESYKLREAEADLAEAEQQVIQATNAALAKEGRARQRAGEDPRRRTAGRDRTGTESLPAGNCCPSE